MLAFVSKSLRGASHLRPAFTISKAARYLSSEQETFISIDRSGLYKSKDDGYASVKPAVKEPETEMARHLKSIIQVHLIIFELLFHILAPKFLQ
jgi:hypothetical protein